MLGERLLLFRAVPSTHRRFQTSVVVYGKGVSQANLRGVLEALRHEEGVAAQHMPVRGDALAPTDVVEVAQNEGCAGLEPRTVRPYRLSRPAYIARMLNPRTGVAHLRVGEEGFSLFQTRVYDFVAYLRNAPHLLEQLAGVRQRGLRRPAREHPREFGFAPLRF